MNFIFKLLSQDLLDKLPPLPADAHKAREAAITSLAEQTEETPDFAEFTLKDLLNKEWVVFHQTGKAGRYAWAGEDPVNDISDKQKAG